MVNKNEKAQVDTNGKTKNGQIHVQSAINVVAGGREPSVSPIPALMTLSVMILLLISFAAAVLAGVIALVAPNDIAVVASRIFFIGLGVAGAAFVTFAGMNVGGD